MRSFISLPPHPKESECCLRFLPPIFSTKSEPRRNIAIAMQQLLDIPTMLGRTASNQSNSDIISVMSTLSAQRKTAELQNRVPIPSHRHAAPSGPWPWIDLEDSTYRTHRTFIILFYIVSSHSRGGRGTTRKGSLHSFSLPT